MTGNLVRFGLAALATHPDAVITLLAGAADVNFYRKSPPPACGDPDKLTAHQRGHLTLDATHRPFRAITGAL